MSIGDIAPQFKSEGVLRSKPYTISLSGSESERSVVKIMVVSPL